MIFKIKIFKRILEWADMKLSGIIGFDINKGASGPNAQIMWTWSYLSFGKCEEVDRSVTIFTRMIEDASYWTSAQRQRCHCPDSGPRFPMLQIPKKVAPFSAHWARVEKQNQGFARTNTLYNVSTPWAQPNNFYFLHYL